jgi:hypothetical protein
MASEPFTLFEVNMIWSNAQSSPVAVSSGSKKNGAEKLPTSNKSPPVFVLAPSVPRWDVSSDSRDASKPPMEVYFGVNVDVVPNASVAP